MSRYCLYAQYSPAYSRYYIYAIMIKFAQKFAKLSFWCNKFQFRFKMIFGHHHKIICNFPFSYKMNETQHIHTQILRVYCFSQISVSILKEEIILSILRFKRVYYFNPIPDSDFWWINRSGCMISILHAQNPDTYSDSNEYIISIQF